MTSVVLEHNDWTGNRLARSAPLRNRVVDIRQIDAIVQALEPRQQLSNRAARCLFSYSLTLFDPVGIRLGEVGICQSLTYAENHTAVLVLDGFNGEPIRLGMNIPDGGQLVDLLDAKLR